MKRAVARQSLPISVGISAAMGGEMPDEYFEAITATKEEAKLAKFRSRREQNVG